RGLIKRKRVLQHGVFARNVEVIHAHQRTGFQHRRGGMHERASGIQHQFDRFQRFGYAAQVVQRERHMISPQPRGQRGELVCGAPGQHRTMPLAHRLLRQQDSAKAIRAVDHPGHACSSLCCSWRSSRIGAMTLYHTAAPSMKIASAHQISAHIVGETSGAISWVKAAASFRSVPIPSVLFPARNSKSMTAFSPVMIASTSSSRMLTSGAACKLRKISSSPLSTPTISAIPCAPIKTETMISPVPTASAILRGKEVALTK